MSTSATSGTGSGPRADILIDDRGRRGSLRRRRSCRDLTPGNPQRRPARSARSASMSTGQAPGRDHAFPDGPAHARGARHRLGRQRGLAGRPARRDPSTTTRISARQRQPLNIGTSGTWSRRSANPSNDSGGVGGAQSAVLPDAAALRVAGLQAAAHLEGRPVLLAKKRYRFEGRLTCVINGKRRLGAEAHPHRDPQQGRQEDVSRRRGTTVARQCPTHRSPDVLGLAHADLPLQQQRRAALAGERSGSGRTKKSAQALSLAQAGRSRQ